MGSVNPRGSRIGWWLRRPGEESGRDAPHEIDDLRGEQAELVPHGAREVPEGRAEGGGGFLELERSAAAAHLERQVRRDGILLAHDELVVGAGGTALGFDPVRDAGELQAALAAS